MTAPSAADLFERHHLTIFRFLRRMSGQSDVAEDLTQEVFLRVVRALESYREQQQEQAWLFRIARNVFADRHRQAGRVPTTVALDELHVVPGEESPTTGLALDQALDRVPEHERIAFLLRELGGLGYSEIAAVTDVTPDAVRNRIHRARLCLRAMLAGPLAQRRPCTEKETAS
jgi:RNA polymerase sigma factor (sigma-70 family)